MSTDAKLADMLALIQTDPGNRGLATHPTSNLFTARPHDFAAACHAIADHPAAWVEVVTGFYIPGAEAFETDGPLGAWFLLCLLTICGIPTTVRAEPAVRWAALELDYPADPSPQATHRVAVERSGPAADGRHYTMRSADITDDLDPDLTRAMTDAGHVTTIGIGDGGNEIGMGSIPAATVAASVPNGAAVHCVVPTDFLVVAGVSNWGAYALAAGVCLLRGARVRADWFDPDRHRARLAAMVERGPLVDGVTGRAEATVDGLAWDVYTRPLVGIGRILHG